MMSIATVFDEFRRLVLAHEELDRPSEVFGSDFFDEIPLYSRYRQVEPFVRGADNPEHVLLDLALEYLGEIRGEIKTSRSFFAAITVLEDQDSLYIVPNVLVCNGRIGQRLHALRLRKPLTAFGKRMASVLKKIDLRKEFRLLEDTLTVPGHVRVFISYPDILERLAAAASPEKH